ncbi:RNA polymerase sigma factor SigM [Actinopolyspora mortivallis]|uniref:RNA polymerase sigma factor SigM n=1 Tax=Actinopolyspora mortivallis TaxID=33906 RepID=A0A2T0GWK1_ACTMO|nr:RNA polymerase sigma factor SigM [Actinopolyspora mortivallis]PRW63488.1 RNA polymerase sigma factor SigM [Actinopolyspora mortivallis]
MSETASSDADLLKAHLRGDRQAFSELFRRHRDRLWSVALRTMRDPDEAADALQEAMISAFRNAGSFRSESRVTTWLHRIVVNACLDRMRRQRVRATVPLADSGPAEPAHPHDTIAEHDTRMVVDQALSRIPEEQRAAVVLVDVEGYPVSEAARMLGAAEGTVKSRCARGRLKLAQLLGHLRNPTTDEIVPEADMATRRQEGR